MSPNPFEAGARKIIPAVLIYPVFKDRVLMIHRDSKARELTDFHAGKWNGLGGKCELNESSLQAAQRELKEEAGLELPEVNFHPKGLIQFPLFKTVKNEDWMVFLFTVECDLPHFNSAFKLCPEGSLHWILKSEVTSLNLWPGDQLFLTPLLAGKSLTGTIWYQNSKVEKHWIREL